MFSPHQIHRPLVPVVTRHISLPLVASSVPAGFPSPAEDFTDGVLDLNDLIEHPAATFVVRVSGWSMSAAGIHDGDLLLVDRSIKPRSGHIAVAALGGEMVVKRLRRKAGRWWLVPEAQEPDRYQAVEMDEESEVWGVVKNVIRCLT